MSTVNSTLTAFIYESNRDHVDSITLLELKVQKYRWKPYCTWSSPLIVADFNKVKKIELKDGSTIGAAESEYGIRQSTNSWCLFCTNIKK